MKANDFMIRQPVIYVPSHVQGTFLGAIESWGEYEHCRLETEREMIQALLDTQLGGLETTLDVYRGRNSAIEYGVVSSMNDQFVFVKYHPSLYQTGWGITSQATSPDDLFTRSHVREDRGHAMSPNCHWIVSEHVDTPETYSLFTVMDGQSQRASREQIAYETCREVVLASAEPHDTYIELHLGQGPTELYLVVIEDHELGTVRLAARDGSDG